MLIAISGKIGSGKDTVGMIIQYLTRHQKGEHFDTTHWDRNPTAVINSMPNEDWNHLYTFEIKKFADTLKDMVCMLIGCTRNQLEDHEFKDTELGEEWIQYAYADGHYDFYQNGKTVKRMHSVFCDKEKYEEERRINWQTAYKTPLTPRLLLQLLGTECGRNIIHKDIWVNTLMSKYLPDGVPDQILKMGKPLGDVKVYDMSKHKFPNWIITDMRFPNEKEAVEKRKGITIRVNREGNFGTTIDGQYHIKEENLEGGKSIINQVLENEHPSETALDNSTFNYTIENNGTIEELVDKVREILIKEKIITNE